LLDAVPVVGVGVAVAVPAVDGAKEAIVDGEVVVAGSLLGPMMGMGVAAASLGRGRRRGEGGGLSASWGGGGGPPPTVTSKADDVAAAGVTEGSADVPVGEEGVGVSGEDVRAPSPTGGDAGGGDGGGGGGSPPPPWPPDASMGDG